MSMDDAMIELDLIEQFLVNKYRQSLNITEVLFFFNIKFLSLKFSSVSAICIFLLINFDMVLQLISIINGLIGFNCSPVCIVYEYMNCRMQIYDILWCK